MTALEILQPHKSKKFVSIKDYDFDIKAYKQSEATQRLGKLMLVMVDGPQSLTIREAAKRLGLSHSQAKYLLKQSRHLHEKTKEWSTGGFSKQATRCFKRFPTVIGQLNEQEETLMSECTSARGSQSSYLIQSEANSSDFSDIQAIDNPDRKSSHSSFKRLSAFGKEKLQISQNTGSDQSIVCNSNEKEALLLQSIREEEERVSILSTPSYIHFPIPVRCDAPWFTQSITNEGQVISSHQNQSGDNDQSPSEELKGGSCHSKPEQRMQKPQESQNDPNLQQPNKEEDHGDILSNHYIQTLQNHSNIHQKILEEVLSWKGQKWIGLDFLIKYLSLEVQRRIVSILEKCPQNPAIIQAFLDALRGK